MPEGPGAQRCTDVVAALPSSIGNGIRRDVEPDEGRTAAWGNPPIVLRCGVAPTDLVAVDCLAVDGVDWVIVERDGDAVHFATFGRTPAVEVRVPSAYVPEAEALVDLAPAVAPLPQERECL